MDRNEPERLDPTPLAPWKKFAAMALAALVAGAVLYSIGLSQGRGELREQKTQSDSRSAALQAENSATQAKLARSQARGEMMQAQLALYRAVIELDRRNFGIANDHLGKAGEALERATASVANEPVSRLGATVSGLDVTVATDLQQQRAQLLEHAEALEALVAEQADAPR